MNGRIPHLAAVALVSFLVLPGSARALDPLKAITQYMYRSWGAEEGLPQLSVTDILQSADGYVWVGTQEGIARFDGVRFTVFNKRNTEAIDNVAITSIAQTDDGVLWFGTEIAGLLRYHQGKFERLTARDGLGSNRIRDLVVEEGDTLWIGTSDGLSRYRGGEFETWDTGDGLPHPVVEVLSRGADGLWIGTPAGVARLAGERIERIEIASLSRNTSVGALLEDADGTLWIGTNGQGLVSFREGRGVSYRAADGLGDDRIEQLAEDPRGALWIGTVTGGLVRLVGDEFSSFATEDGLRNNWVASLAFDREGNLWVGTLGGGLGRFGEGKLTPFGKPEGLSGHDVWSVFQDSKGAMWIGTNEGLNRFESGRRTPFYGEELFEGRMVIAVLEDSSGRMWFGTRTNGLWRYDGQDWRSFTTDDCLPDMRVGGLTERADGSIWFGSPAGAVRLIDDECTTFGRDQGLFADSVKFVHEDRTGTLWLGTFGGGVIRQVDDEFVPLELPEGATVDQTVVLAYHEDDHGAMWFGTTGGLLRVKRDGQQRLFTETDGLHAAAVLCILEDDEDNLWISSNYGIYRVSKRELDRVESGQAEQVTSHVFGADDGMRVAECIGGTPPACWKADDGLLWFATLDGTAIVDPDNMPRNRLPPPVVIEQVLFDGRPVSGEAPYTVRAGTRKLEFHYTALSFVASEHLPFKFKLEGFDTDWVDAGTRREAYYTAIPPGDYRFRVIAANSDGVWNREGASVSFSLEPLFHQTIAFRLVLGAALVLLGLAVAGFRIRQLRRRERELVAAVESRTADLRALTEELRDLSLRDPLTGLRNRRFLFEAVSDQFASLAAQHRAMATLGAERRSGSGRDVFAVFMVDVDRFKQVNDSWGHDAGDRVLVKLSEVLRGCIRADDVLVRWGGEEFLIVLSRTDWSYPDRLAEKVRTKIAETGFDLPNGDVIHKTCSVGLATYPFFEAGPVDVDLEQLIALADYALLRAKESGRDQCLRVRAGAGTPADRDALHEIVTDSGRAFESQMIRVESVGPGGD
jgi:diguanylate cyclase (GGDEF)-like protein